MTDNETYTALEMRTVYSDGIATGLGMQLQPNAQAIERVAAAAERAIQVEDSAKVPPRELVRQHALAWAINARGGWFRRRSASKVIADAARYERWVRGL